MADNALLAPLPPGMAPRQNALAPVIPAPAAAPLNGSVLTSADGRMVFVGVEHGKAPTLPDGVRRQIQAAGQQHGFYYEGNGDDRAPVQKAFGDLSYKGSMDDLVTVPNGGRSNFLYTMFSNPPEQTAQMVDKIAAGGGTILDALHANRDNISHEAVRGQLSRDDIAQFLDNTGFGADADKPATRENLQSLMQRGAAQMWPDNWQEFPNPAGKVAHAAETARLSSIAGRGSGVYFIGADNLPLLQKINPKLRPLGTSAR